MKDCPQNPPGPKGPWYKHVRALLDRARRCETTEQLVDILGQPDEVLPGDGAEKIYVYVDPYRRRHRYRFGVGGGALRWSDRHTVAQVTEDTSNDV